MRDVGVGQKERERLRKREKCVSWTSLRARITAYYSSTSNKNINWVLFSGWTLALARKNLDVTEQGSLRPFVPSHRVGRK